MMQSTLPAVIETEINAVVTASLKILMVDVGVGPET